ncbi:hypothetical protein Halru_1641 [Halovivax ruber XH-70]|uniref:Transcriptional regulator n=1 Tax=Halovivax ruber (strain DSM 18193 / JCM 13892 / XH-70) TaxID=797302 RepID=L0IBQ4_HALRX|nr:hypothetical protein Halru_1641 [Halovivax ruber XH-70]
MKSIKHVRGKNFGHRILDHGSVDRNVSAVSRNLDVLFEADLIEYERDGRSKRPQLAHQTVLIEPLVFDGEVQG